MTRLSETLFAQAKLNGEFYASDLVTETGKLASVKDSCYGNRSSRGVCGVVGFC